jgi:hypothetical protein
LVSDAPSQRSDERVVEVVVSADGSPLLVGQRALIATSSEARSRYYLANCLITYLSIGLEAP